MADRCAVEQHYTVEDVAGLLKVTPRTVHTWISLGRSSRGRAGLWPARKLGRNVLRIPASAVARLMGGPA